MGKVSPSGAVDGRVVVDGWYAVLPGACSLPEGIEDVPGLGRLPLNWVYRLCRFSPVRGVMHFLAGIERPAVGICRFGPGWGTLLLLRALLGRRRKLVVFQFILHRRRHPLRRLLRAFDRWAIRRTLLWGHALTREDQRQLAAHYGLAPERFIYVPWPLAMEPPAGLPEAAAEPLVLSAGRAYCDWPTLFEAAGGSDWPLRVVCDKRDRGMVDALNAGGVARVSSEIPRDEFFALLDSASVSVVALETLGTSHGHIRISDAVEHGIALVVTGIASVDGYVEDGVTALVVPPGDPQALRAAVDRLLADPGERERLRASAHLRSLGWHAQHYLRALDELLHGHHPSLPEAAPDPDREPVRA